MAKRTRPPFKTEVSHVDLTPKQGKAGMAVKIHGEMNLVGVEKVLFKGKEAKIIKASPPKSVEVTAPEMAKGFVGEVEVTIETPHGHFEVGKFTYA